MLTLRFRSYAAPACVLLALASAAEAQVFVNQTAGIPSGVPDNASRTENVDFADVDLDGDFDAVFADGGDGGNDQNRIWINLGGLQAGTEGTFRDRTAILFPAVSDTSRDVEFADFEGDGDFDLFISNTSSIVNQASRFWINVGGDQGGTLGAYVDETSTRWVGLGAPGSAVNPSQVLPGGGFLNWSADSDFADFDNDGDLDLFHSTYGGAFGGQSPSYVFLNDGAGYFSDFNPSGFTPASSILVEGSPALWAQGVQASDTADTTGAEADIKSNGIDVELFDQDGDLDLDLILGTRESGLPRYFRNLLEENGGAAGDLAFRDLSNDVFPPNWALGNNTFDQEVGDFDADGDFDLYGMNWGNGFADRLFRNNGGVFGDTTTLASSNEDESEGDFFDYDNDGKLDLYIANFSGADRLHRNVDTGAGSVGFQFIAAATSGLSVTAGMSALDADAADLDGDGDYDLMTAVDSNGANLYLENQTQVADSIAPRLYRLEVLSSAAAVPAPRPARVQVYDNTPYYITWYNPTALEVAVDGCSLGTFAMRSSGGQVFRGELPGQLVGQVQYTAHSQDRYGNTASSTTESYVATDVAGGSSLAFGSDSGVGAPSLRALSVAFPGSNLYLGADGMTPGNVWFLAWNQFALAMPIALPGTAVANVAGINFFTYSGSVDAAGCGVQAIFLPETAPPASIFFQMFEFPGDGPDLLDSSRGLRIDIQP